MTEIESNQDYRSLLSNAVVKIRELKARVAELERGRGEPIAIVGIGCRFAGGINSPEDFWQFLKAGKQAVIELPTDRREAADLSNVDSRSPGKIATSRGSFLPEVDRFDAAFFGISSREATSMDPQHRLLLEVGWEALEHAGLCPEHWYRSQLGVFVGISSHDYAGLLSLRDESEVDEYLGTGISHSTAAGRISHLFGFQGPSVAVDTACSSSLVATHLACQSLRTGECDAALVGGVNVVLLPEYSIYLTQAGLLSPSGCCRTFDAAADGVVRGEGCGVVVLKRLSDADADRDNILAVIRGSAVNHDGPSGGLTVPNGPAQQALIRRALDVAGVSPSDVSLVEAHGAGTPLGDSIEIGALAGVYGRDRSANRPLLVASHKTNLGHLEAAGGIAGLIKVALSMAHNEIPPHVGFEQPNPKIAWDKSIHVPTQCTAWPNDGNSKMAGVSSFSFCGTNAHLVLEEGAPPPTDRVESDAPLQVLTLSAKSPAALRELARRYAEHLQPAAGFADICFTAHTGRSHFEHRLAVVAGSASEAAEKLASYVAGREVAGLFNGLVSAGRAGDASNHGAESGQPVTQAITSLDSQSKLEGLAQRYVQGKSIDWKSVDQDRPRRKVPLPTYPFQRERFWVEYSKKRNVTTAT